MQEVAQLEGDQQELYAENRQLNKQQNALASEVRKYLAGVCGGQPGSWLLHRNLVAAAGAPSPCLNLAYFELLLEDMLGPHP